MSSNTVPAQLAEAEFPASGRIMETPAGFMFAWGGTVPTDGASGYAPGCQFTKTNGTSSTTVLFVNIGSKASCNFDVVTIS
jgi:hypothetical protein